MRRRRLLDLKRGERLNWVSRAPDAADVDLPVPETEAEARPVGPEEND